MVGRCRSSSSTLHARTPLPTQPSSPLLSSHRANGSILNELSDSANAGLTLCGTQLLPAILAAARLACPALTAADAIQVVGAATVAVMGGPTCSLLLGRPDSSGLDDSTALPDICYTADQLVTNFGEWACMSHSSSDQLVTSFDYYPHDDQGGPVPCPLDPRSSRFAEPLDPNG